MRDIGGGHGLCVSTGLRLLGVRTGVWVGGSSVGGSMPWLAAPPSPLPHLDFPLSSLSPLSLHPPPLLPSLLPLPLRPGSRHSHPSARCAQRCQPSLSRGCVPPSSDPGRRAGWRQLWPEAEEQGLMPDKPAEF